jgi:hypothetical protein
MLRKMWVMDSLTRGGLGWGQTIVDTLIMTYQTSSKYQQVRATLIPILGDGFPLLEANEGID